MTVQSLNDAELDQREAFCRQVIRSAGVLALRGFKERRVESIDMKGPQNFLTETDAAVERHIRGGIAAAFPGDGFLGEETGGVIKPLTWVVDPIDGTANFARHVPHFCIAIALVSGDEIELGATYNPVADELHFARRGQGATLNDRPVGVASTANFDAACVELGWSNRLPNEAYLAVLARILALGANVRRSASGALGLAYVADGRSDAYAELHMNPWDCLAGLLLVREAGGVVGPYLQMDGLEKGGPVLAVVPGLAAEMSKATGIVLERPSRAPARPPRASGPILSDVR
jgi:myo-inositol-1(or 4)-monophosphatase